VKKFRRPFLALHHDAWLMAAHFLICVAMMFLLLGHESHANVCTPLPTSNAKIIITPSKNDTATIESAIKLLPRGGTLILQDGTYMIDALKSVRLKSNMTLILSQKATLKGLPDNKESSAVLNLSNVSNVNVVGTGTIEGNRYQRSDREHTHGHGILIWNSKNVVIEGITTINAQGDGIYIGGTGYGKYITLCNVIANNNRRQGISIVDGKNISIRGSRFYNTHGDTNPECGMDIEPNPGQYVDNVYIYASRFSYNANCGLVLNSHRGPISNVLIKNSRVDLNIKHGMIFAGKINNLELYNNVAQEEIYIK